MKTSVGDTYKTAKGRLLTALKNKINTAGPTNPMQVINRRTDNTVHLCPVINESAT